MLIKINISLEILNKKSTTNICILSDNEEVKQPEIITTNISLQAQVPVSELTNGTVDQGHNLGLNIAVRLAEIDRIIPQKSNENCHFFC